MERFEKEGWYWVNNKYDEIQVVKFEIDEESTEENYKRKVYITKDECFDNESNYVPLTYLGKDFRDFENLFVAWRTEKSKSIDITIK